MKIGPKAQSGKQRWQCVSGGVYCSSTTRPGSATDRAGKRSATTPIFKRTLGGATTLLIAYAQNATPVHRGFIKALETCANHRNAADILVVPGRYKNPTSRFPESQANEDVWDGAVVPYLCNQRKRLNKNLVLLGDSKIQPTAREPLSGYEALTHGESGIVGHPQLALTTIATPQSDFPKLLTTTGACTVANYTDSKAGRLGEFHHTIGAALVEIKGKAFHLRQINASKDTGEFIDLRDHYNAAGRWNAPRAKGLVMGDTHRDFIADSVVSGTFGPGGMVEFFEPEILVWHDLDDNHSVNPHHGKNPFIALAKIKSGRTDPKAELERAVEFVVKHTPSNAVSYIVWSNHNIFLRRWIEETDPRTQPTNMKFWSETAQHMAEETKLGPRGVEYPDPFVYWARKLLGDTKNIVVLDQKDKLMIGGIACHMHGHDGPNGSRGSRRNLAPIGVKSMIGHGHGPGIHRGCTQVGTSTDLEAEYTHGPGGWMQTHGTINALNKRCLHNLINGEFRA